MNISCYIHGLGEASPERILTNDDLTRIVDTSDEWIRTRTGIGQRHVLADSQNADDLGAAAASQALEQAGLKPEDITHIFAATTTPPRLCPSLACLIAGKLGCRHVMAMDCNAACTGFLYGLSLVRAQLAVQPDARILLICAEALTRRLNWTDRSTCVLFGDGAGAVVCSSEANGALFSLTDVLCSSDSTAGLNTLITIGGGSAQTYSLGQRIDEDFFLKMQGREVFKHAVRAMTSVCNTLLDRNDMDIDDIQLFIPHQANLRIIEAVGQRLSISSDRVFTNVDAYGNTSSASVPIALCEAWRTGRVADNAALLLTAFGAGLTWGAALLQATKSSTTALK